MSPRVQALVHSGIALSDLHHHLDFWQRASARLVYLHNDDGTIIELVQLPER